MMRGAAAGLLLLICATAGPLRADAGELEEEQARAIAALHPFGVRGLPDAYKGTSGGDARPKAIEMGLTWLSAHQTPDGSWRPADLFWCRSKKLEKGKEPPGKGKNLYETGVTGMAVSAYLGAGYTHRGKHPFAKNVRDAIGWLVKHQDKEGCFGPRSTQQYIYNHAFATMALVEAYALTGDAKLREPAQKAIDFSAIARNPFMAWRYGIKPGDNDTSVTGCMGVPLYIALRLNRAGQRAGMLEPLGLDDTVFDGIRNWIDRVVDPDYGRAGYVTRGTGPARPIEHIDSFPGEKSEACTAIAVLMRLLLPGWDGTREMKKQSLEMVDKGTQLMLDLPPLWQPGQGTIDLYYWYYGTMVMRQLGGKAWKTWDDALATALLNSQRQDGDVCNVKGSWDPEGVWSKDDGGRIYATLMCLLMLETPDRMRPLPDDRSDLLQALESKGLATERVPSILRGLGILKVPKAGGPVASYIAHDDPEICAAAAEALGRLDAGAKGARAIGKLLADKRLPVRRAAVRALAGQGQYLRPLVDTLVKSMGDPDVQVAAGAARALGVSGIPEVAAMLQPRLQDGAIALRVAAAASVFRLTQDKTATLPVLIRGLGAKGEEHVGVRIEAATTIEAMAPGIDAAEKALIDALVDDAPRVRVHAAGALHAAGKVPDACIGAWISALDAVDGRDRLLAMERLLPVGSAKATPKLAKQLLTGSTTLRVKAAEALEAAKLGARPAAAALSWCSANGPSALRKAASNAFEALELDPREAKKHLLPVFEAKTPDQRLFEGAARALVFQGREIVGALVHRLTLKDGKDHAWMLDILRRLGRQADASVPGVTKYLREATKPKPKYRALRTLSAIGPAAASALPVLKDELQHETRYVRTEALTAIGEVAKGSDDAVAVLMGVAADQDKKRADLRQAAIRALGKLDARGEQAIPQLLAVLEDTDENVRRAAIDALHGLWPISSAYLMQAIGEARARVRNGAAQVVSRVGEEAKKFAKPLVKVILDGNFSGKTVYGDALIAIGKPAVKVVMKMLRESRATVRGEGARILGGIGPPAKRAISALKKLLSDPDFNVRFKAEDAIKRIKPPRKR